MTTRIVDDDPFGEEALFGIEVGPVGPRFADSTGKWADAELRITWSGDALIRLDDIRFDSELTGSGGGTLVTAGRGCVPQWFEDEDEIKIICLKDRLGIYLEPGESHGYVVKLYTRVEPRVATKGVYYDEERIRWWWVDGDIADQRERNGGDFNLELRYEVH